MRLHWKQLWVALFFLAVSCGGGSASRTSAVGEFDPNAAPSVTPSLDEDFGDSYVNSFVSSGIDITVDPHEIDFGVTAVRSPLESSFTLTNNTSSAVTFKLTILSLEGGFHLIAPGDTDIEGAQLVDQVLAPNSSKEYKAKFLAGQQGGATAVIDITAQEVPGFIRVPLRGEVSGLSAKVRIISSNYMCSDREAPELELEPLDFMKVATNRSYKKSIKICNRGNKPIKINSISFQESVSHLHSQAMDESPTAPFSPFEWSLTEELNQILFPYYTPSLTEPFLEPGIIPPPDEVLPVDGPSSFSIHETSTGVSPNGIVIGKKSYARLDVEFSPSLNAEAPEDFRYASVPVAAQMEIDTSAGTQAIELVGATSGKEPLLALQYSDDNGLVYHDLSLIFQDEAISFPNATVFTDWITERGSDILLRIQNVGSGSKELKVWFDPINDGFFTFVHQRNPEQSFPLTIESGRARIIKLRYAPTPQNVSQTVDMGQLVISHNGGNGPQHRVTLIGKQSGEKAVTILQGGLALKPKLTTFSPPSNRNFCVFDLTEGTDIKFKAENHSTWPGNNLSVRWRVVELNGATAAPSGGDLSVTPEEKDKEFVIHFTPVRGAVEGADITGRLSIVTRFAREADAGGVSPPDYYIAFTAKASAEECVAGTGAPINGKATVVIDRITMILPTLTEAARNLPPFKFHLPIDLDMENRRATVSGLTFDPNEESPVKQIRSYAHQVTNVTGCAPLATNPYHLEYESQSWSGPGKDCSALSIPGFGEVDPSAACLKNNGAEEATDPRDPSKRFEVYYHEFVKIDPTTCAVEFYGRISTFARQLAPTVETIQQVFARMPTDPNAPEADFDPITRPYDFGSFIHFNVPYTCPNGQTYSGRLENDPEAIRSCWVDFSDNNSDRGETIVMERHHGDIEECSYFQFNIEAGCAPGTTGCGGDPADPDTWKGYGEYEPRIVGGVEDETLWDLTLRNVHIQAFVFAHGAQNGLFGHSSKLLFSDLYVTLTTKPIGGDIGNLSNNNPADEGSWKNLVAVDSRDDFESIESPLTRQGGVFIPLQSDSAVDFWTGDGLNSEFTTSNKDQQVCDPSRPMTRCRGNYMITSDGQYVMHAGEPIDFQEDHARLLLAGLAAFHGKGQTAPGFAREDPDSGKGPPLYFTFHGCLVSGENLREDTGCYTEEPDNSDYVDEYRARNMIAPADEAIINYKIFDLDRNRQTNYYEDDLSDIYHPLSPTPADPTDVLLRYTSRRCGFGQ